MPWTITVPVLSSSTSVDWKNQPAKRRGNLAQRAGATQYRGRSEGKRTRLSEGSGSTMCNEHEPRVTIKYRGQSEDVDAISAWHEINPREGEKYRGQSEDIGALRLTCHRKGTLNIETRNR